MGFTDTDKGGVILAKKVYAIKEGFNFETNEKVEDLIVDTWDECLKYVKGVKKAKYKSFSDISSAREYLKEGSKLLKKSEGNYPEDCLHIYVDGSYNISTEMYAYGFVAVRNGVVEQIKSGSSKSASAKNIRQIAGELEGAVKGVEYALKKGEKKVVIFHDYEGISHHVTGLWERKDESSIQYYNKMNELINSGIEVIFVKVDSHTGDLFNELVDEICKEAIGVKSDKAVDKLLSNNYLKVANDSIKEHILKLAPSRNDKIIVLGKNDENSIRKGNNDRFQCILEHYKEDKEKAREQINNLSEDDKMEFIFYLLEKAL